MKSNYILHITIVFYFCYLSFFISCIDVYADNLSECSVTEYSSDDLFDISNDKVYEFYLNYSSFNDFKLNASKDYLYFMYKNDLCSVYEYSLATSKNTYVDVHMNDDSEGDKFVNVRKINQSKNYVNSGYLEVEIRFNELIDYYTIDDLDDRLYKVLQDNGIYENINGACIITSRSPDYMPTIFCVFTDNGVYWIEFNIHMESYILYNNDSFKGKYLTSTGKFIHNDKKIYDISTKFIYGEAYISIRDFLEYLGCDVYWDSDDEEFGFSYEGKKYQSKDNYLQLIYYINDENFKSDDEYYLTHALFDRYWHPMCGGFNIDGTLYFDAIDVDFLAQRLFGKRIDVDYDNMDVIMTDLIYD